MKLVASMVVRNELGRYLEESLSSLLEFCDEVVVFDDRSDDGTSDYLLSLLKKNVRVFLNENGQTFFEHEGAIRQRLLNATLAYRPTHILAIDADEFISDGKALRAAVSGDGQVWTLQMTEIWTVSETSLYVRIDRQWGPRPVPVLYKVLPNQNLRILNRALACGREPVQIRQTRNPTRLPIQILHFGWTNPTQREDRYARYQVHDGGRFHANAHLLSILDGHEVLEKQPWPDQLLDRKPAILRHAGYDPQA